MQPRLAGVQRRCRVYGENAYTEGVVSHSCSIGDQLPGIFFRTLKAHVRSDLARIL